MSDEIIVKVEINGKTYPVSCNKGEEKRVYKSAKLVSDTISNLNSGDISASDNRLLVMASMILADKIQSNNYDFSDLQTSEENKEIEEMDDWLDKASQKLNRVARLIEES